jgi:septation ring formation regulator EzrA
MTIKPRSVSFRETSSNEELIEAVVEEKWNELVKDINKIIEWKNATSNRIAVIEQKIEDMRREFDKLHSGIIAKVDDYDKNISNVGAEVKAMEKVFSKVLPVFAENVSELSRIAKDIKRPSGKPSKDTN